MKTKELIKLLQAADPSGEDEVCVGNVDIHFVAPDPAYWDGPLQVLERNEESQYYNIIGAKYKRSGRKIVIHTLSITDAICNDTKLPVDYSELPDHRRDVVINAHNQLRVWYDNMENEHEEEYFVQWAKEQALKLTEDIEDIEHLAKSFFREQGMSHNDLLPRGGVPLGKSYVDTRKSQWSELYEVVLDSGFLSINLCK